jgi:hypothetical protein
LQSREGAFQFKVVIHKKDVNELVFPMEECAAPTAVEARHVAAVCALEHECGNLSLEHVLPPEYRELWKRCGERSKQERTHQEAVQERKAKEKEIQQRIERKMRDLPQLHMNENARDMVQKMLQGTALTPVPTTHSSDRQHHHHHHHNSKPHQQQRLPASREMDPTDLARRLRRMGFVDEHVQNAVRNAGTPPRLDSALDWLLLNLRANQLPKDFNPIYSSIEIVQHVPAHISWLTSAGFPLKLSTQLFEQQCGSSEQRTLLALYRRMVLHGIDDHRLQRWEDGEPLPPTFLDAKSWSAQTQEVVTQELEMLRSIFDTQLRPLDSAGSAAQQSSRSISTQAVSCGVAFPLSFSIKYCTADSSSSNVDSATSSSSNDRRQKSRSGSVAVPPSTSSMEVHLYWTEGYPATSFPLVLFYHKRLSPSKKLRLMHECSVQCLQLLNPSDGFVFQLKMWLEENVDSIFEQVEKEEAAERERQQQASLVDEQQQSQQQQEQDQQSGPRKRPSSQARHHHGPKLNADAIAAQSRSLQQRAEANKSVGAAMEMQKFRNSLPVAKFRGEILRQLQQVWYLLDGDIKKRKRTEKTS